MRSGSLRALLFYCVLFLPALVLLLFGVLWLPFLLTASFSAATDSGDFQSAALAIIGGLWGTLSVSHLLVRVLRAQPWRGHWLQWCGLLAGCAACVIVALAVPDPFLALLVLAPIAGTLHLLYKGAQLRA